MPSSFSRRMKSGLPSLKARLMPRLTAPKKPSAPHSRKMKPTTVRLPRELTAASIISLIRSGSMGVFCANQVRMMRRASPSPIKAVSSTAPSSSTLTKDRIEKYAMDPA